MNERPAFRPSHETRLLYERLSKMTHGDKISNAELSKVAGVDIQTHRGPVQTARRWCEREHGLVFDVERGKGLICLNNSEKVALPPKTFDRVRRMSQRVARTLDTVDYEALSPQDKVQINVHRTVLAVAHAVTTAKKRELIAAACGQAMRALPIKDTLALFTNGKGGE